MAYCDSCNDLKTYAPDFILNGVTDDVCESLVANTGFNADLRVAHKNCEDLKDMADCLLGALIEKLPAYDECTLKEFIAQLAPNTYNAIYAIICSQCGLWQRLENLEDVVNSILRQNYQELIYGTDYTQRWFSDWYSNAGHVSVRVIETPATLAVRVLGSSGLGTRPRHDNLKSLELRHTQPISERPRSRIFGIRFLGNYAKYNNFSNYDYSTYSTGGTGVWNAYNSSGNPFGGSHMGVVSLANNYTDENGDTWTIMGNSISYADGYNLQFTTAAGYPDGCYLPSINMSCDATFIDKTSL